MNPTDFGQTDLVFMQQKKPLCIVCITYYLIPLGIDVSLKSFVMYCL